MRLLISIVVVYIITIFFSSKSEANSCTMLKTEHQKTLIRIANNNGFSFSFYDVKDCIVIGVTGSLMFNSKREAINFDGSGGSLKVLVRSIYGGRGICIKPGMRPFEVYNQNKCY